MPRKPRFFEPDVAIHVLQHGHNRESVFFEKGDYQAYSLWLTKAVERYACATQ